jgi:hypothetical protein
MAGARCGRGHPHRAAGDRERRRRAPERDAPGHPARPRVDADHGAGAAVGHPDPAEPSGDRTRAAADAHRVTDRVGRCVDPCDGAVVAISDPNPAVPRRDRGRPVAHTDCPDRRARNRIKPGNDADLLGGHHTAPPPAAIAAGPPGTSIRRLRPPFATSIRSTCPSTGEASHTAPAVTATPRDPLPAARRPTCRETCPQLGNYDPAERDLDERNRR